MIHGTVCTLRSRHVDELKLGYHQGRPEWEGQAN